MKRIDVMNQMIAKEQTSKSMYASFLKRKRLERGLKLEDVASGICSVSYLSRIENNMAMASDENLKALFERLDLNYENVKKERERNIYEELLTKELSQGEIEIVEIINQAIENKAYSNIELDLLILYNSILNQLYEEAKEILIKQEVSVESYCNHELVFYLYLFARYLHETNQNKRAYSQIRILCSIDHISELMRSMIYDLAINVLFIMGKEAQMVNYFYLLSRSECSYLFATRLSRHQLKLLLINSHMNYHKAMEQMQKLANTIDMENQVIKSEYYYIKALIYCRNNLYEKAISVLTNINNNIQCLTLYGYLVNKYGSPDNRSEFITKVKNYKFNKYDNFYHNFCEYLVIKFRGESPYHLYTYLKMNILNDHILFYDSVMYHNALAELMDIGLLSSKHKETLRYVSEKCSF